LHSDRGFQYTRKIFSRMLENDGLTQSMSRVGHCIDNGPVESFQGFIKDMAKVLFGKAHTYEEAAEIIYRTYEYYIYRYPQKRFHGKTANQVRQEALTANTPEQYPIAPNRRIERFWEGIEKSKAKHQAQAQQ
ncbi:MAG TPA: IS3 family transposase, partial [Erysipelotrichaceae bacterium]|nr:IS3 family transposase [Erysipelotrichaceae bacterium]